MKTLWAVLRGLLSGVFLGALLVVGFVIISAIFMLLANVVLTHYELRTLDLQASLAIIAAVALLNTIKANVTTSKG